MATRAPLKDIKLTPKQEKVIGEWFDAQAKLDHIKAEEAELRENVLKIFYPGGVKHEGTENWAMPGGWIFKVVGKANVKIDETMIAHVRQQLKALGPDANGVLYTIDETIKYKPAFSASGFKALSKEAQKIVCQAVTFTPGSPAVSLEKPKAVAPKAQAVEGYNPFAGE